VSLTSRSVDNVFRKSLQEKMGEFFINKRSDPAMVQVVSCRALTVEVRFRNQATPREIFGGPLALG
jgi:hypothetical protein